LLIKKSLLSNHISQNLSEKKSCDLSLWNIFGDRVLECRKYNGENIGVQGKMSIKADYILNDIFLIYV